MVVLVKNLRNFKKLSTNITQKLIHKRYSKLAYKCYSKSDPQMLLKKGSANVTQKVIYKRYLKNGLQNITNV